MDLPFSAPTIWAAFGVLLLIIEMFTLTFVMVFFGLAALVVAAIKLTTGLNNLTFELLIFAALGAACLLGLRGKMQKALGKRGGMHIDQQQVLELSAAIGPQGSAKIEYQGTLWDAVNDSDQALKRGDKVTLMRTEGIKLVVRPRPATSQPS